MFNRSRRVIATLLIDIAATRLQHFVMRLWNLMMNAIESAKHCCDQIRTPGGISSVIRGGIKELELERESAIAEAKRLRKALRSVLTSDSHDSAKGIARKEIERHADGDIQTEVGSNEKRIISEIWDTFYGQNLQVANWHKNGELEPMDQLFRVKQLECG